MTFQKTQNMQDFKFDQNLVEEIHLYHRHTKVYQMRRIGQVFGIICFISY
jgi:hypothetical protein